jgi:hypothetical protein
VVARVGGISSGVRALSGTLSTEQDIGGHQEHRHAGGGSRPPRELKRTHEYFVLARELGGESEKREAI